MARILRYDYLIVGGGIAGVAAAETIRGKDRQATICIVSKEPEPLYSRVLLGSYARGKMPREKIFLRSLSDYTDKNIDVLMAKEVVVANFDVRDVRLADRSTLSYGKLLLAAGSTPVRWRIIGEGIEPIFRLHTIGDADGFAQALLRFKGRGDAIIVGGGFVALEFLESAVVCGYKANLLIKEKRLFASALGEQGSGILEQHFARHGITIHTDTEVKKLVQNESGELEAYTNTNETIKGVWLGLDIGVERNFGTFQGGGLKIGRGIVVNEYLESSVQDVWAAGEIAGASSWNDAFLQGHTAGINMAARNPDERKVFDAVSTYSMNCLGYNITTVGDVFAGDDAETIVRVWPDGLACERFFFREGKLVGAFLINRFIDKPVIAELIKSKIDLSESKNVFQDPEYEIAKLYAR